MLLNRNPLYMDEYVWMFCNIVLGWICMIEPYNIVPEWLFMVWP